MHYHECFTTSPIVACDKLNDCSFTCFACNISDKLFSFEIAPIAFSKYGDFVNGHDKHVPHLHTHHAFYMHLNNTNGDVHKKRYIMMDDVFLYHAHRFFLLLMMCVGTKTIMSTSVEHELTKRALESIPHVSSRLNPALIPFAHFASFKLKKCSFLWFACKHVNGITTPCDNLVSMLLDIDALCVATIFLNIFSF